MKQTNFTYAGVLPKKLTNTLISSGKRMKQSVPQIPFNGVVTPKIKRSNTAKRLSPSMNKKHTFLSNSFSNVVDFSQYPPSYPLYPPPEVPNYPSIYPSPLPNQPSLPLEYRYMNSGRYDPVREERLRATKQRLQASNSAIDTSREVRGWANVINNSAQNMRATSKYLGYKPDILGINRAVGEATGY